jgi:hypothetical protein
MHGIGGALPDPKLLLGGLSLDVRLTTLPLLNSICKFEVELSLMYLKESQD